MIDITHRIVTTVEELEALPVGTAFRTADGELLEVQSEVHDYGDGEVSERWYNGPDSSNGVAMVALPATVLSPAPSTVHVTDEESEAAKKEARRKQYEALRKEFENEV